MFTEGSRIRCVRYSAMPCINDIIKCLLPCKNEKKCFRLTMGTLGTNCVLKIQGFIADLIAE